MGIRSDRLKELLRRSAHGERPGAAEAGALLESPSAAALLAVAADLTRSGFGDVVTYSRKVFIPLTQLCRDVCHYCEFAKAPQDLREPYLSDERVLEIAALGERTGCHEALFTLGEQPERRYRVAREELQRRGFERTLDLLQHAAGRVFAETRLLPHLNPGTMGVADLRRLRTVSASMGLMLESAAPRLSERGGPHHGSPDKHPQARLATLRAGGEARVPMTSGLLIGIGETRRERLDALLMIRDLHDRYGHIQEIIIQNFRAKPGTRWAAMPEPSLDEQCWTIAAARLLFGATMSIQAPPNLRPEGLAALLAAGVNDWGGVSPVTPDHVNPEAPWPAIADLDAATAAAGRDLAPRLAITPPFAARASDWCEPPIGRRVRELSDSRGFARVDDWTAGSGAAVPTATAGCVRRGAERSVTRLLDAARRDGLERESDVVRLFETDGASFDAVLAAADQLRADTVGDIVSYVVNRNINYTNICKHRCAFCAFSKGRGHRDLRGPAYDLPLEEIARRAVEAAERGATEVCLQGGIHPDYDDRTYVSIVRAIKEAVPQMHIHAFSPLEVLHGANAAGLDPYAYLVRLREIGLSTLPGTAAEILDDEVRAQICHDKLTTDQWLSVVRAAHLAGLRTTSTIMFGHLERPVHWARHLLRLRTLQCETGGITEIVPLPFVHMEAPMWRRGLVRPGPTYREALLMHAVARLTLHPWITNVQASWVKMGPDGAAACLRAGANDLGGTLMDESITRAAGGVFGQRMSAESLEAVASSIGRTPRQRDSLYRPIASAGKAALREQGLRALAAV